MTKLIPILLSLLVHNIIWSQEMAKVQVLARPLEDKVLLRWAVDQPLEWQQANNYGFLVERITITRNEEPVLPMERKTLTPVPLKPKPIEEWKDLAKKNKNAAIVAQALYGKSFEVNISNSVRNQIMTINEEMERRFTFALLAADQSYDTAKIAGWGLEDTLVKKGETYLYKVSVAIPDSTQIYIEEGTVDASLDYFQPLPKPIGLVATFGDKTVLLNWDFESLKDIYTSYLIERSEDRVTFHQLTGHPLFQAHNNDSKNPSASIFYTDSIVNNKKYYYRVRGISPFGENGPPSDIIEGIGYEALKFTPRIYKKEIPDDNTAILFWEFPEDANKLINGFELNRSNNINGPYEAVITNIPPTSRKATYKNLKRINYFKVIAKAKNNSSSASYATIVQPIDSIPPSPPTGLKGEADTTGLIKLEWTKNTEEDFSGYRIFRSKDPSIEFFEVTKENLKKNVFVDTLNMKLNKNIYYKIKALDQRYNASKFSEVLKIELPTMSAPSPPVINNYKVTNDGIEITWTPSTSRDIISHDVYRNASIEKKSYWKLIASIPINEKTVFVDTEKKETNIYNYVIIAKTKGGLESNPSKPIQINYLGETSKGEIGKFSAVPNRELRFIHLTWKATHDNVSEYRLYKSVGEESLKLFKTFDGKTTKYSDYQLKINSKYSYALQIVLNSGKQSVIKKIDVMY
ncbi:hypothetical protein B4Q04_02205 [Zobellia sp. OII3]|uniref:fibronectin type III domain-containing protein n=1 Tax=Zobellia sp. OII3 TaxID=2034520 RepID=UPI000B5300FC|nr:hypothetical protein [Zobellia sp. OII3]OWW26521.1 hypothetical protein B4Q04_02205 [Zobellia sp. OII3]